MILLSSMKVTIEAVPVAYTYEYGAGDPVYTTRDSGTAQGLCLGQSKRNFLNPPIPAMLSKNPATIMLTLLSPIRVGTVSKAETGILLARLRFAVIPL